MSKFSSQKEIYDEIFEKQVLFDILSKLLKNLFLAISFKSNAIKIVYSVVIILETLSWDGWRVSYHKREKWPENIRGNGKNPEQERRLCRPVREDNLPSLCLLISENYSVLC
jgi:hypothetical protein